MKDKWICIQQWMISELGLKGSELIAYALIYGINQNKGRYYGSAEYLAETWLGITPKKGYRVLASLVEKGLLSKTIESGKIYYEAIIPSDTVPKGGSNNIDNIDNIENIDNINNTISISAKRELVNSERGTTENLCLFTNSKFAKFEDFAAQFTAPEYQGIDMYYYWQVIMDWSNSGGNKKRDWIATTRNWIRSDAEKGKVHRLQQQQRGLSPEAVRYLESVGGLFDE